MKYKAKQLTSGDFAVFSGNNKYFTDTVTADKKMAKKMALMYSAQWYYAQAEEAYALAEKEGLLGEYDTCLGDWLC